jgi:ABC-type sugar transport system ATPase subunit
MLSLQNINKSFSGVQVLFDINTIIEEKKVTAVIGENGAGKSTLMNILSGGISDYTGTVVIRGQQVHFNNTREALNFGITIIHQELNIFPDLTAGENIFLGREPVVNGLINYSMLYSEADKVLKQFRFPYPSDIKMRSLSVGWKQIVEIARALSLNSNIIIMDEPTSALSDNETEILFEKIHLLREQGKTIIFISHRISEVLEISDHIIVMRDGRISASVKTEDTTREELIRHMAGDKTIAKISTPLRFSGEEILNVKDLSVHSKSFNLSEINFDLKKGEVLGIAGLLGSGRTELLKFLFGEFGDKYEGTVLFRGKFYKPRSSSASIKSGIVYLPENRKEEGIFPDHSLVFNSTISVLEKFKSYGLLNLNKEATSAEGKFNELNVKRRSSDQEIKNLSGGNQQKVLLARILMTDPSVILMDDPTRGIDIGSKEEIYELINIVSNAGISVIMTSSEIPELLRICSKVLVLSSGKQTALLNSAGVSTQQILAYAFKQL